MLPPIEHTAWFLSEDMATKLNQPITITPAELLTMSSLLSLTAWLCPLGPDMAEGMAQFAMALATRGVQPQTGQKVPRTINSLHKVMDSVGPEAAEKLAQQLREIVATANRHKGN